MDTDHRGLPTSDAARHTGDFSGWKDHDSYQIAFQRLLRDLRAAGGAE
jgi:hypothetical protein